MKALLLLILLLPLTGWTSPEADRVAFREYYEKRFPKVSIDEHIDGAYALDAEKREQWLEMEDFPPYEIAVDDGQVLYEMPFANGEGYASCFDENGAVKHLYPYYDIDQQTVITLELAVNECREQHGENALAYDGEEMALLTAYIAFVSRGRTVDTVVPPEAMDAYNAGKQYYYSRRGQLNFACSHCHMQMSGMKLRAETLSASIGQVTHWPAYRFKWQEVGSLHRRFAECNDQVGAEGLPYQSEIYRNLEFFLSFMSQGMPLNGPGSRK